MTIAYVTGGVLLAVCLPIIAAVVYVDLKLSKESESGERRIDG